MNKLKEILQEFEDNFAMEFSYKTHDRLKKFLQDKFVEYARSVLPPDGDSVRGFHSGTNLTIIKIENRIDQDLLSLKEKNI